MLTSFGETLVFRNVPSLRPGRSINLSGIYLNLIDTSISVPFDGSAMMSSDGKHVRIGIFVHEMGAAPLHNFTFEWTASDATFAGSGYYDSNGDYLADGPVSFSAPELPVDRYQQQHPVRGSRGSQGTVSLRGSEVSTTSEARSCRRQRLVSRVVVDAERLGDQAVLKPQSRVPCP